jgi:hypothetical protein
MKTSAEEEGDRFKIVTTNMHGEFQVRLSNVDTEASTSSMADTDLVISQRVQVICGVTSTQQMQLENEFPIHLIEFEA